VGEVVKRQKITFLDLGVRIGVSGFSDLWDSDDPFITTEGGLLGILMVRGAEFLKFYVSRPLLIFYFLA